MNIENIQVNHMTEPLGFDLSDLKIEFSVNAVKDIALEKKLEISVNDKSVYQTDWQAYTNNYFQPDLKLDPRTRYNFKISVRNTDEDILTSAISHFETGKMNEPFSAKWVGNDNKDIENTLLKRELKLDKDVKSARIYMSGLGVYELNINGKKVGDELLAPGTTNYDKLIQIQTYDATDSFIQGDNTIEISLGDGWYKGNLGFDGGKDKIYGDQQRAILELHLVYNDGTEGIINTDDQWLTTAGKITKSAIYYGEDIDDTIVPANWVKASVLDYPLDTLADRLSLPLKVQEYLPAKKLIHTPKDEQVIDFGQNNVGIIEFYNREPKGTKITIQVGEILQKGNFYRDNLREARAAFTYISDGTNKWVRPHFTYYGYRYIKISGNTQPLQLKDFRAAVIYSDMKMAGDIKTDNSEVNRLFENVQWSQKGNFFDVPTDCPQRDERLGWTGDAEIFSNTSTFNMNVYAFFKKYAKDIKIEQDNHDGMLTMYAPSLHVDEGGAAIWGDAATIIPWNMYSKYGDTAILKQNYSSMKSWVDWIRKNVENSGTGLWTGSFQFGDWLSLDSENPAVPNGKTDEDFIASVYYYYSSSIVANAAKVLGNEKDYKFYKDLCANIKHNILKEYITETGRVAIDTQTAYALVLEFNLVPENLKSRVVADLVQRLKKDNDHLQTGFVGTPFLCQVLSENGEHELATKIFLNEDYPSWLYAVKLGATTIWERWNSVLSDGSMNPEGMNSLNHYSIGAIMEWAYKYVLGLHDQDNGYQTVYVEPKFDYRMKHISGHYDSSYGDLKIKYDLETDENHTIALQIDVPYGQTVKLTLPRIGDSVNVDDQMVNDKVITLTNGHHQISYIPTNDYIGRYTLDSKLAAITADKELFNKIKSITKELDMFNDPENVNRLGHMSIKEANMLFPFINIPTDEMKQINRTLTSTPVLSEREA
ncbi:family 78 glycoside hydrolase catalytic domain [Companilactobacillus paralimentarius]|uniref:alpha-L-rhamnosidase n=1 Tax=Companilactobacillus paralimentarius TaxID=83526 RepID=UPI00384DD1DE